MVYFIFSLPQEKRKAKQKKRKKRIIWVQRGETGNIQHNIHLNSKPVIILQGIYPKGIMMKNVK